MTKEVMKQALDALNESGLRWPNIVEAIKTLEEALKQEQEYEVLAGIGKGVEIPAGLKYYYIKPKLPLQQKQEQDEPVGVANVGDDNNWYFLPLVPRSELPEGTKLYAKPQKRKPLTIEQIGDFWLDRFDKEGSPIENFARSIEAAHGIKE